ncbi:MAG: 30S ribosomal protein S9 [Thermoanaerobacteraceae bacterium]|uniref:30S ribosomal protein S9 n=1 Tax=Thermanaeromonas sp. C210 TaxID=2731925 RepID=UPI00155C4C15|nr:30S ribosomal protein S9 [Thermanaeromonas sp. C210]MBE3580318.1 30S ribosomal protein S9 [Thermoanaerobacteraceae bacterium]GFN23012.1 30S ribosomal protein S9 [Thermanaeromonas sp. C210]
MAQVQFYGTGRRKEAVARVRLIPGEGRIIINDRTPIEYFGQQVLADMIRRPLEVARMADRFDVVAKVEGGGLSGQAGAVRLGIARALLQADAELRPVLRRAGFLTRDPRMKERRKYGLKKARKAPQFSKR